MKNAQLINRLANALAYLLATGPNLGCDMGHGQNFADAQNKAREVLAEFEETIEAENDASCEPHESHDLSDDAEALASAGHGTDEDYGGEDRFLDDHYESQYEIPEYEA